MVLVDTTVWVDFFGGLDAPHVVALEERIQCEGDLCICGIVLTEVLQGIRSDAQYCKTKAYLEDLVMLPMRDATFVRAAETYRSLRKRGVTIRKPMDCMIAAVALEHGVPLLHNDRDFGHIARHTELRIHSAQGTGS